MKYRLEGFPLNIRILQEYIAFARVLNFSKAAQECFISQSSLSTHMQKLEDDLGVALINHGARPSLTPCGKLFLQYAENIVVTFLESIEAVKRFESGRILTIEEPQGAGPFFAATISAFGTFADEYPDDTLSLRPITGHTPLSALQEGVVDIAKLVDAHAWDHPDFQEHCRQTGISVLPLVREMPVVWLQQDHPLAAKETLTIADLRGVPIMVPADVRYDTWRNLLRDWFAQHGMVPVLSLQVTETMMEFYMIRPKGKVFILPESLETGQSLFAAQNVVPRVIADEECAYYVSYGYLTENDNPLIPLFLEHFKRAFG